MRVYVREFIPRSWFHQKGIYKVLDKIWPRLPNVNRCLFATFTIDRNAMAAKGIGPGEAFEITRDRIRKIFYRLRKGVEWEGKTYRIDAAYCTKVEFHSDVEGWPHFHVIWLTRRFVPHELLREIWGYGRINVKRIDNNEFHYLLKYVCKSGQVPDWVKRYRTIRVFQPSRGFLMPQDEKKPKSKESKERKREIGTIGERLERWSRTALLVTEYAKDAPKLFEPLILPVPFRKIFDRIVHAAAMHGRYLGGGKIQIKNNIEIIKWIQKEKNRTLPTQASPVSLFGAA